MAGEVHGPKAEDDSLGARVLHCYAQAFWHTEAYISGNRGGLLALRAAIDQALDKGSGDCDIFAGDGEGYTVHVVAMSDADATRQVVPYTDEIARQPWARAFGPWEVIGARGAKQDQLRRGVGQ